MSRPPAKEDFARTLLLRGSLFVYLDPRREGVRVPPWLSKQAQLVLQVGLDLPIPIPDLRVDDEGVYGTLSFNRSPFTCRVPWDAVFGLVGDDGMGFVWNESLPEEIAAEVADSLRRARRGDGPNGDGPNGDGASGAGPVGAGEARGAGPGAGRPRLRAIEGGAADDDESDDAIVASEAAGEDAATSEARDGAPGDEAERPRPHLRLVK